MTAAVPPVVAALLRDTYTDEGVRIWWRARNRNLHDERPVDLWTGGGEASREAVVAEADRVGGEAW